MNCLFLSCHAALEYYMSQIFKKLNVKLPYYDMDIGNIERPLIAGYREASERQRKCNEKHCNRDWSDDDLRDIDFIYMMNFGDVPDVALYYAKFKLPIIVHLFGQYNIEVVHELINAMLKHDNIFLVCYSQTEYKTYFRLSFDNASIRNRLFYIPFGLDSNEFGGWNGNAKKVYTTCNDIHNRGNACGWEIYQEITRLLPSVLSGRNTEDVGGIGLLQYDELKRCYGKYRCYLSMGTIPAPYTLTPLEAMMTGCPTVIYDNGMGVADEDIQAGLVSSSIDDIQSYIKQCLNDKRFAKSESARVRSDALKLFDMDNITSKWESVISQIIL